MSCAAARPRRCGARNSRSPTGSAPASGGRRSTRRSLASASFPETSLHFWQEAVERAGWRTEEIFNAAYTRSAKLPGADQTWAAFIARHPSLALEYVPYVPREQGAAVFEKWWLERGSNRDVPLTDHEAKAFYKLAPEFSTAENFASFMQARPALALRDFLACAKALHAFGDDAHAWQILSVKQHEPDLPKPQPGVQRADLERRLRVSPDSATNARSLAALCQSEGDVAGRAERHPGLCRTPHRAALFHQQGRVHSARRGAAERGGGDDAARRAGWGRSTKPQSPRGQISSKTQRLKNQTARVRTGFGAWCLVPGTYLALGH